MRRLLQAQQTTPGTDSEVSRSQIRRPLASAGEALRLVAARATALDVWAFVLPATSFIQFQLVGRLVLSEILALVLLPWLLLTRDRIPLPKWLLGLWAFWLVSQIATDLVVGSAFTDWARGWAAIMFTLINLLAILALAATPRRARIFAAGLATGSILAFFFSPTANALVDAWKFAFAGPVTLAVAIATSGPRTASRPWMAIVAFGVLGALNAILVFRSMSGVVFLTAAFLALVALSGQFRAKTFNPRLRSILGVFAYCVTAVAVYVTLNAAISAGVFGESARVRNDAQSGVVTASGQPAPSPSGEAATPTPEAVTGGSTPLGPIVGGRAEFLASTQAIRDSPIIGHGSWARDAHYAQIQRQALIDMGVPNGNLPTDPDLIPTHSYLLGSWVWAGIAGGLFWMAIAILALRTMAGLFTFRIALAPLVVLAASWLLWNIAFSPYGNTERLYATFAITACLLGLQRIRRRDQSADVA